MWILLLSSHTTALLCISMLQTVPESGSPCGLSLPTCLSPCKAVCNSISASPAFQTCSNSSFWISFSNSSSGFPLSFIKKPPRRHRPQALTLTVNTGAARLCDSIGHHSDPFCDWAARRCWTESEVSSRMEVFWGNGLSIDDQLRAGMVLLLQMAEPLTTTQKD